MVPPVWVSLLSRRPRVEVGQLHLMAMALPCPRSAWASPIVPLATSGCVVLESPHCRPGIREDGEAPSLLVSRDQMVYFLHDGDLLDIVGLLMRPRCPTSPVEWVPSGGTSPCRCTGTVGMLERKKEFEKGLFRTHSCLPNHKHCAHSELSYVASKHITLPSEGRTSNQQSDV